MSESATHDQRLRNELALSGTSKRGALPRWAMMLATIGVLAFSSTSRAQIVEPADGDYIGYMYNAVDFSGYTFYPGATIKIQARNNSGQWVTIATTTASSSGHWGIYSWSATTTVPTSCWIDYFDNVIFEAEVRAVRVASVFHWEQLGDPIVIYGWSGGGS